MQRINALIRCTLHLSPGQLTEDEWYEAWGQVKYYLSVAHMVKFE